jgi:hypothetical protein
MKTMSQLRKKLEKCLLNMLIKTLRLNDNNHFLLFRIVLFELVVGTTKQEYYRINFQNIISLKFLHVSIF